MDKERFRTDKNEKLIALLEKRDSTVTNNYTSNNGNGTDAPQNIMGKPVVIDTVPRDGQVLSYNAKEKEWEADNQVDITGKADTIHASQHYAGGADPLTAANVGAEPDLGDVGSAGIYGIQETILGLHGIAAINRTNIVNINRLVKTIETDTYTVEDADEVIICNKATAMFIYVPATSGTGQRLYIKNINTGIVTVDLSGTETLDGELTVDLDQWDCLELVSYDTGKWAII